MDSLHVATYNIHKGMSPLNRHLRVEDMACALGEMAPDLLFLQEVQGHNLRRAARHTNWPESAQHDYLASRLGCNAAYGLNAAYQHGHHGNALLSRHPIVATSNLDISVNRFESRGVLHCEIHPDGWPRPVVALCIHLNLLAHDRRKQYAALARYLRNHVSEDAPLILAGDFNDWRGEATLSFMDHLGLSEVFRTLYGQHALSFPARMPVLPLDRIYTRGLMPVEARIHRGMPWASLSDHLPLSAQLMLKT